MANQSGGELVYFYIFEMSVSKESKHLPNKWEIRLILNLL